MIVFLNRDEIEEAIRMYVKDKLLPYGDKREIHVTQERKVTAKVTFGDDKPDRTLALPGLDLEDENPYEDEVSMPEVDGMIPPEPRAVSPMAPWDK